MPFHGEEFDIAVFRLLVILHLPGLDRRNHLLDPLFNRPIRMETQRLADFAQSQPGNYSDRLSLPLLMIRALGHIAVDHLANLGDRVILFVRANIENLPAHLISVMQPAHA